MKVILTSDNLLNIDKDDIENIDTCDICFETYQNFELNSCDCNNNICKKCFIKIYLENEILYICPFCKKKIKLSENLKNEIIKNEIINSFTFKNFLITLYNCLGCVFISILIILFPVIFYYLCYNIYYFSKFVFYLFFNNYYKLFDIDFLKLNDEIFQILLYIILVVTIIITFLSFCFCK